LDAIDFRILDELQRNARIPFAELGRRLALSTPSAAERVHKLEEAGVIVGYHAQVCPEKIGLTMAAFVKVSVAGDCLARFAELVIRVPEVIECHRVTGAESYILHVAVEGAQHLEQVIDSLMPYVSTNTSMILASPISWSPLRPRAACEPNA
jgi:Lrp/AsnC family leucine-responsive transcriptional regulator